MLLNAPPSLTSVLLLLLAPILQPLCKGEGAPITKEGESPGYLASDSQHQSKRVRKYQTMTFLLALPFPPAFLHPSFILPSSHIKSAEHAIIERKRNFEPKNRRILTGKFFPHQGAEFATKTNKSSRWFGFRFVANEATNQLAC